MMGKRGVVRNVKAVGLAGALFSPQIRHLGDESCFNWTGMCARA